ncbi:hypothetical protein FI667_g277, partial [Globisporangium splendens]
MVSIKIASLLAIAAVLAVADVNALPRVHPGVHRALRAQATVDLILTMNESPKTITESIKEAAFDSRGQKIANLVERLETHSKQSQTSLNALLSQEASSSTPLFSKIKSFWISNQVFVKDATFELVEKLAALPSLSEVREQLVLPAPAVILSTDTSANNSSSTTTGVLSTNEWGVEKIHAPSVWALGNTAQNIVVGSIDTGVLGTHEALKANYRESYGWFDPPYGGEFPADASGHGTHTMGSILGANGLGVAPGAKWMACRGCQPGGCFEADLLACAEFMTCPTDPLGENKDCSKAPNVINNSWGGTPGSMFYQAAVDAWHAADIIPIFGSGNVGKTCSTVLSPGDYANVITVGGTDQSDTLGDYSCKGPSLAGVMKPEVSAPGTDVRSAWSTSDNAYVVATGTSMATPHVTGIVALLLQNNPNLTYGEVKTILTSTVDNAALGSVNFTCGGIPDGTYPNNLYGYGRVNALSAVQRQEATAPGPRV